MSGFDVSQMLPLYLDEADEFIGALNDMLLRLEQNPDDAQAIQEVFRCAHSMKGSSALMGFEDVKRLTHELETLFDQLRGKQRQLDLPLLQLFFRCLDALRDYHKELRSAGTGSADLASLTAEVIACLAGKSPAAPVPAHSAAPAASVPEQPAAAAAQAQDVDIPTLPLRVTFEEGLQLADMKARLVLNRLGGKGRILKTDPPAEQLDERESLRGMTIWIATQASWDELKLLADVDGVTNVELVGESGNDEPAAPHEPITPTPHADAPAATVEASATPPPPEVAETASRKTQVAETVRVDLDRLDSLMNLAGELVINKARFLQVTSGLENLFRSSMAQFLAVDTQDRLDGLDETLTAMSKHAEGANGTTERWLSQLRSLRDNFKAIRAELELIRQGRERLNSLSEAINQLARVTDGIQKGVLNTRMVPIGPLFNRFRRIVRDMAVASGKEIQLQISGEKTELDKRMIDELGDPLIHMVRNAIDHGLEPPEERRRLGKPAAGTVSLSAVHRGNSVVITVADDGRGIDIERVRRKAVSSGLHGSEEAARMTERELINLIWHAGLSTAERVTDISGRGVGMDIVKSRIEGLNGTIDVRTALGQGTNFAVRLPLTLAIMPSLLVRIYEEIYAIPLDHVDEIVESPPARVHMVQGQRTMEIRRKVIGLSELREVFRWGDGAYPASHRHEASGPLRVVVVQNGESRLGLVVDELIGIQEVVLKSLQKNYRPVQGLSGASILGDGRVSLILDVDAVMSMAEARAARHARRAVAAGA